MWCNLIIELIILTYMSLYIYLMFCSDPMDIELSFSIPAVFSMLNILKLIFKIHKKIQIFPNPIKH